MIIGTREILTKMENITGLQSNSLTDILCDLYKVEVDKFLKSFEGTAFDACNKNKLYAKCGCNSYKEYIEAFLAEAGQRCMSFEIFFEHLRLSVLSRNYEKVAKWFAEQKLFEASEYITIPETPSKSLDEQLSQALDELQDAKNRIYELEKEIAALKKTAPVPAPVPKSDKPVYMHDLSEADLHWIAENYGYGYNAWKVGYCFECLDPPIKYSRERLASYHGVMLGDQQLYFYFLKELADHGDITIRDYVNKMDKVGMKAAATYIAKKFGLA